MDLENFEKNFSNHVSLRSDAKFIGFKTFKIPKHRLDEVKKFFGKYHQSKSTKLDHLYFDLVNNSIRKYFVLGNVVIQNDSQLMQATKKGTVNLNIHLKGQAKPLIAGRKKTKLVTGGKDAEIHNGNIIFNYTYIVDHTLDNNTYVYNLEAKRKVSMDSYLISEVRGLMESPIRRLKTPSYEEKEDGYESESGGVSCVANHGGQNCTAAFGINNDNGFMTQSEKENADYCIDFNGSYGNGTNYSWDNTTSKISNWAGSDCSIAMNRWECWNEIM